MSTSTIPGAWEAVRRLADRSLTAEELLRACLDRIALREPEVHAWAHLDAEGALARARALDAGPVTGPLHGLPIGIKDIIDAFDMPTGHGSPIWAGHRPFVDSALVALCRGLGGVIVGKTVTTEFATFTPPPTRNPLDLAHTPGGSSSGSAAAIADGMVPLAFGSQTAGSLIRPGAYCGAAAYKPSYQTLPVAGVKTQAQSLDTIGTYGRTLLDAALGVAVIARRDELHPARLQAFRPRIGIIDGRHWGGIDADMQRALDAAAATLSRAGAEVRTLDLPDPFPSLRDVHTTILLYEMGQSMADELRRFADGITPRLRGLIRKGAELPGADYAAAIVTAQRARAMFPAVLDGCDVALAPAAQGEAPTADSTGESNQNAPWTLLHGPAAGVNAGRGSHGLPLGLQVVGPIGSDARTLCAALWIEDILRQSSPC